MSLTSSKLSVTLLVGGDKRKLVYFEKENARNKLRMFKVDDEKKVNLDGDNGRDCSLKAHSSSYIRCNGTEDDIPEGNAFKLNRDAKGYFLEVKEKLTYSFITKICKSSCSLTCLTNHRDLK